MGEVALHRQFAGQARLIRLLLWRIGDSTDLGVCFDAAREQGMISEDDEVFLCEQLALEEANRDRLEDLASTIDEATVKRMFRCADKLNRADSA